MPLINEIWFSRWIDTKIGIISSFFIPCSDNDDIETTKKKPTPEQPLVSFLFPPTKQH